MIVIDDDHVGERMLKLWDVGHDTSHIAAVVGLPEPRVYRTLIFLRGRRRRERLEREAATQAADSTKDAPAST